MCSGFAAALLCLGFHILIYCLQFSSVYTTWYRRQYSKRGYVCEPCSTYGLEDGLSVCAVFLSLFYTFCIFIFVIFFNIFNLSSSFSVVLTNLFSSLTQHGPSYSQHVSGGCMSLRQLYWGKVFFLCFLFFIFNCSFNLDSSLLELVSTIAAIPIGLSFRVRYLDTS